MGDEPWMWSPQPEPPSGADAHGAPTPPPGPAPFVGPAPDLRDGVVMWPLEPPPRRRRRGLWIGVGVGVVVLAGGLAVGWALLGSKLVAPASPTAAVSRFVDGVQHKDLPALAGSLSPAEVAPFRQLVTDLRTDVTATADPAAAQAIAAGLDSLTISANGLQLTQETLDEGLAKVSFTGGTLTVDGDPEQIADAVVAAVGDHNPLVGSGTAGLRQDVVDSLDARLPYTVDIARDWAADGAAPYLVTVREGHGWYVSPLMTLGEYAIASQGVPRGAMPRDADIAHPASPEDALKQLAAAIPALVAGDSGPLVSVLPQAERRFVAVYVQPALDRDVSSAQGQVELTLTASDVEVTDRTPDRASVMPRNLAYRIDIPDGAGGTATWDGGCLTGVTGDGSRDGRSCLGDQPLLAELGLDRPVFVTVHEDGGWYVSVVDTLAAWVRTAGDNLSRLRAEGALDDGGWWSQQLSQGVGAASR